MGSARGWRIQKLRVRQLNVMAAWVKTRVRRNIAAATHVSLAFDAAGPWRFIRLRMDTPQAPYVAKAVMGAVETHAAQIEDLTDDYMDAAVARFESFFQEFFSDQAAYTHFK